MQPLEDPARVGKPLEARNPVFVSDLMREAAMKTRQALSVADPEPLLRGVFGHPKKIRDAEKNATVGIGRGGVLGVGAGAAHRHTTPVQSHGGDGR
ncbi:MAG: hypothetical protein JWO56_1925, partial [Acidobacteria bacterium]|nr:hypothetical protein [Acidobacteriota bacterium]